MDTNSDLSKFLNVPKPLFDIKNFLPEGISPAQNGILPPDKLQTIHCGRKLYIDAARSWMAMVRAAEKDKIFLNLNRAPNGYRSITVQLKTFKRRFMELDDVSEPDPNDKSIRVEFNEKIWQLKENAQYVEVPGQGSHGFGLAVSISNAADEKVKAWLEENAEQFGFKEEYDFESGHFAYTKSRESIPRRVFEMEQLPPEPTYTAEQIAEASGCVWATKPSEDWCCRGLFYSKPYRAEYLIVVDQGEGTGIKRKDLGGIFRACAGIICTDPEDLEKFDRPKLLTLNPQETIEKLTKFFKETAVADDTAEDSLQDEIEDPLQSEINFYEKANPETAIFQRKKALADLLLTMPAENLQIASTQFWYEEYLALLAIHIENPALKFLAEKYIEELLQWYEENIENEERAFAVLGMLQFMKPQELPVPLDQQSWDDKLKIDVKGVFSDYYTRISYSDDNIANYYLYRQKLWRHGKRKMRIAFVWNSTATAHDKILPVYELLKAREDVETFLVLTPNKIGKHAISVYKYFKERYPDEKIYDSVTLTDLRKLRPDYVFYGAPYDYSVPIAGFHFRDVVQFAKICHITYGSNLAYAFIDRLLEDHPQFYCHAYFMFCSGETVKNMAIKKFKENVDMGYTRFEFLGYPILERYYQMPATESSATRILWTPRCRYDGKIGGSHFFEYRDKFVALRAKYGDKIELSMRPHKLSFRNFVSSGLMTEEDVTAYIESLEENNIKFYEAVADIDENIRETDIFLADYSSMLIVLILTGRPVIYCEFPNAIPLPEYEEMFDSMYIANSWEDVEKYVDDLMTGNDPLFEKRQEIAKKLYELHKGSAQKIADRIIQDFKDSQIDDE